MIRGSWVFVSERAFPTRLLVCRFWRDAFYPWPGYSSRLLFVWLVFALDVVRQYLLPTSFAQTCFERCAADDAIFFLLVDGNKCGCGFSQDFLEEDKVPDTPTSPCSGSDAFTCGGPEEYEIYLLFDDIPVDGAFCYVNSSGFFECGFELLCMSLWKMQLLLIWCCPRVELWRFG